jgi:Tol biopolymer transport system component
MSRDGRWGETQSEEIQKNFTSDFLFLVNDFEKLAPGAQALPIPFVEQITPMEVVGCGDPCITGDSKGVIFEAIERGSPGIFKDSVICYMDLKERVTRVLDTGFTPSISPDHKYICWNSPAGSDTNDTFVYEIVGKKLAMKYSDVVECTWSYDSRFLVFRAYMNQSWIYYADVADFKWKKLFNLQGTQPTLSPDGKILAYMPDMGKIHLYYLNEGRQERLTHFGRGYESDPCWSPDGRWIVYTHRVDPGGNPKLNFGVRRPLQLYITNVVSHKSYSLGGLDRVSDPAWSPDGKFIIAAYNTPDCHYNCLILIRLPPQLLSGMIQ